ncbi:MAG: hypothetical protein HUJ26_02120 [Planctomycetaceae bacterium]|nr:hypothetical protein [Planctomycetaceae bacterium]
MSSHYAVSIYTKLRMDLPAEWVEAFTKLATTTNPEEIEFPAIPDWGYAGNQIPCLIRFTHFNARPVYDFGRCHDASSFDGTVEYHTYHLTFWNIILDDDWYHQGMAFLSFLARYSDGNRFAGTMYETCGKFPQMIYFINGEIRIVDVGADGKYIEDVTGISF